MYLKISNIKTPSGNIDYKGLDITKFVPGLQAYGDNYCVLVTTQKSIPDHPDIIPLSYEQYQAEAEAILQRDQDSRPDPIEELRQSDLDNKEAIAALYEMLIGGGTDD